MFEVIAKDDPAGDFIVISVMKGTEDWDKSKVIVTPNGGTALFGDFSGMPNQSTAGDDVQLDTFVDENGVPAVLSYSKGERVNVRIVSLNNNEVQFHTDLIVS